MKWISTFLFFVIALSGNAQEMILPLTFDTSIPDGKYKDASLTYLAKDGDLLQLPFIDDFSVDHFPGNDGNYLVLWQGRQASRNFGWGKNPPTLGVVSFDGADAAGYPYDFTPGAGFADTLTSCPINLLYDPSAQLGLSFYYQPKGNAFFGPSSSDSLFVEFFAPDLEQWFYAWGTNDNSNTQEFSFAYIPISADKYLKEGFQFRFRNRSALQGAFDTWNVDYIWLDQNNTNAAALNNDVAFVRQEFTFLEGLTAMPRDHFASLTNPASLMRQDITVKLGNLNSGPRTLEGNTVRIIGPNSDTFYPNPNNPAIAGGSTLDYNHAVGAAPNNIVFDATEGDTELIFDVQIYHTVSDFAPTNSNDTMRFEQKFFTNYAYDDRHAEAAYAVPGAGDQVALKYNNYKSDSVFAIQIYAMPISINQENTPITIRIWEDAGNGPGAVIAEQLHTVEFNLFAYQQSTVYAFDEPVYVPSGNFYVGYGQASQVDGIPIGLDFNTNANPEHLYFNEGASWVSSQIPGTVMIQPMFTSNGYMDALVSVKDRSFEKNITVYPNPASSHFQLRYAGDGPLNVSVFDISGRKVAQRKLIGYQEFDVNDLSVGMYVLMISDGKGNIASKKLMIRR